MQKIFFFILLVFVCELSAQTPNTYVISGDLRHISHRITKVYLKSLYGFRLMDSCVVQNGKYHFTGHIKEPFFATLWSVQPTREDSINILRSTNGKTWHTFLLDPNCLIITSERVFGKMKIRGSKANEEWEKCITQRQIRENQGSAILNETLRSDTINNAFSFQSFEKFTVDKMLIYKRGFLVLPLFIP